MRHQRGVEFLYLDIFKKIVDGFLSGTVCVQSCLEARRELHQHAVCSHIPEAALVTLPSCAEPLSSGHLLLSVRRMHVN